MGSNESKTNSSGSTDGKSKVDSGSKGTLTVAH
jgi:hypothetical protein